MSHIINAEYLNIRSTPKIIRSNIIIALPKYQEVKVVSLVGNSWSEIATNYRGNFIKGYCKSNYLSPFDSSLVPQTHSDFSNLVLHRTENNTASTIHSREHWTFPIGAPNRPVRNTSTSEDKKTSILEIIDYLDVENSERYRPSTYTYCNIYAHDFAYLCGTYLPRVWWTEQALVELAMGKEVKLRYGVTYREMNANSLYNWLEDWGHKFGWQQYIRPEAVQDAANEGKVCLCSARNKRSNRSGHISCIIPAHGTFKGINLDDKVERFAPLMSQAGRKNKKVYNDRWWESSDFVHFGFWVHE